MGNSFEIHIAADNIEQAKQEIQQRARKALTAIGIQGSSLARMEIQKSPSRIDTGLLRNSITYALDGEGAATSSYSADSTSTTQPKQSSWTARLLPRANSILTMLVRKEKRRSRFRAPPLRQTSPTGPQPDNPRPLRR